MIALPLPELQYHPMAHVQPFAPAEVNDPLTETKLLDPSDSPRIPCEIERFTTLGRLLPGIAHDVNNLLSVICGYAELLTEELASDDPRRELTSLIVELGQQAGELLTYVNGLSRTSAVNGVRWPELLAKVGRILPRYVGADLRFSVECAAALGSILLDPIEAVQVVLNLVGNARDATPQGGAIAVRAVARTFAEARPGWPHTVPAGRFAVLTVADTGRGMDDDTLLRIFEPHFTTRADRGGTGTGLATVARIVAGAHGFIQVESEPDWGTRFRIFFPVG